MLDYNPAAVNHRHQLARELGTTDPVVARILREHQVELRGRSEAQRAWLAVAKPNRPEIAAAFLAGRSVLGLARDWHCSRQVILRVLRLNGLSPRSRSEAETLKWRMMREDRRAVERQLGSAWRTSRGKAASHVSAMKSRRSRREAGFLGLLGRYEGELAEALIRAGVPFVQQFRIACPRARKWGRSFYQVDLASHKLRVAVEIEGSWAMNPRGSLRAERLEHILNSGFSVLALVIPPRRTPVSIEALAHHVIAFSKIAGRNDTVRGQYGMIDRHGHPMTFPGFELDGFARVRGF